MLHLDTQITLAVLVSWLIATAALIFKIGRIIENLDRIGKDLLTISEQLKEHIEQTWTRQNALESRLIRLEVTVERHYREK